MITREAARQRITVEQELHCYPPDARRMFLGDPAAWLPGAMTMRGGSVFRTRLRLSGMSVEVQFRLGTPWTRGTSSTRRLQVVVPGAPYGMGWLLPAIDGDLNLLGEQRLRLRFEGATSNTRALPIRRWVAGRVMRAVVGGICARLTATTPKPRHVRGAVR
jgi:hypothetical protein